MQAGCVHGQNSHGSGGCFSSGEGDCEVKRLSRHRGSSSFLKVNCVWTLQKRSTPKRSDKYIKLWFILCHRKAVCICLKPWQTSPPPLKYSAIRPCLGHKVTRIPPFSFTRRQTFSWRGICMLGWRCRRDKMQRVTLEIWPHDSWERISQSVKRGSAEAAAGPGITCRRWI